MQEISISFPKAQSSFIPQRGLMTREQRKAVDLLGVNWIVQKNLPLSVTSSPEFHDYMSLASNGAYQGASRDTNYGVLIDERGKGECYQICSVTAIGGDEDRLHRRFME